MVSKFEGEYVVVVSTFTITIFVLTWYKRRWINLLLERYTIRDEQHTNYISRVIYGSNEASIAMLRMKRALSFELCDLLKSKGLLFNALHISVVE